MTDLIQKAEAIAAKVAAMPEVEDANVWTRAAGKERIYVNVIRTTREGKRYGGNGGTAIIDLNTGRVVKGANGYNGSIYCNSFTKDFHENKGTTDKIREIVAQA